MTQAVEEYSSQTIVHEPHGFVRLVEWCGSELSIVNAARVSLHKESFYELDEEGQALFEEILKDIKSPEYIQFTQEFYRQHGKLSEADKGLINFLLRQKHGTPFEQGFMAQLHFRVPIFVMREWIRHRIGYSYNEESGRYVQLRNDYFLPEKVRTQHGKPGAYTYEDSDDEGENEYFRGMLKYHSEQAYDRYQQMLDMGIAKEQARLFLPLNLYTEVRWTVNARSLMSFLALRNDVHAMQEIREYAAAIEEIFKREMPTVHQAFEDNGRVAP